VWATLTVVLVVVLAVLTEAGLLNGGRFGRVIVGLCFGGLFVATLVGASPTRQADAEMAEAIDQERQVARPQAFAEAGRLAVIVLGGLLVAFLARHVPQIRGAVESLLNWPGTLPYRPVAGLVTGLWGWIVAGGFCWLLRVAFTVLLRKEALGFGDVHIVAAAGAVLGPYLAIAGFFLAAPIALLGTAVLAARKRSAAVPFGPYLALGVLVALAWGRGLIFYLEGGLSGAVLLLREIL